MTATQTSARQIRITYIGGGSRYWAPQLMGDLARTAQLGGELVLYDINHAAAKANVEVANAIFSHPQATTSFKTTAVSDLDKALRGADFVVMSIEPGPITARYADLEIPRKAGILQPVGDTTGPGGILRALRAVPIYADYAHRIMAQCPKAWVINYTNPMTLCTAALYAAEPDIQAFGCCHEVFGTQNRIAKLVAEWFKVDVPPRQAIRTDVSGVNHFTWVTHARWQGEDLMGRLREMVSDDRFFRSRTRAAEQRKAKGQFFGSDGMIAFDLLRRFGALGAAGDRHLAEFVPWYLRSEADLHRWGVVLTPYSWRVKNARQKDKSYKAPSPDSALPYSGEEGVLQMLALLGLGDLDTNVNLPNRGQAPDLPLGAVVETNAQFRRNSVTPVTASALPEQAAECVSRVIAVQETTLQAALDRDVDLAFQALLNDPLVTIATDQAHKMFTAMLRHVKDLLPGWKI